MKRYVFILLRIKIVLEVATTTSWANRLRLIVLINLFTAI